MRESVDVVDKTAKIVAETKKHLWSSLCHGAAIVLAGIAMFACLGATRIVPDFSPTIQAAIDSSATGDTVLVHAGYYVENLRTDGKELTLRALGTPETTIIDGNQQGSVIWVTADAHIEGFTIQNGLNNDGGGILVDGPPGGYVVVTIKGNRIVNNRAGNILDIGFGGGVMLHRARGAMVANNTFSQNYAGNSGGGVYADLATNNVAANNVFIRNGCHACGGAIGGGMQEVTGNLIAENWSDSGGGGICGGFLLVRNNTVVKNYHGNSITPMGAGILIYRGVSPVVERNIVALNYGPSGRNTGIGLDCFGSDITVRCNDVWGNDVDWFVYPPCDTTGLGNFSEDPRFCDPNANNYELNTTSPCTADNSPGCGLVGAFDVGCMTPTVRTTWGRLKSRFGSSESEVKQ